MIMIALSLAGDIPSGARWGRCPRGTLHRLGKMVNQQHSPSSFVGVGASRAASGRQADVGVMPITTTVSAPGWPRFLRRNANSVKVIIGWEWERTGAIQWCRGLNIFCIQKLRLDVL